jgi:hypothetical protein
VELVAPAEPTEPTEPAGLVAVFPGVDDAPAGPPVAAGLDVGCPASRAPDSAAERTC